MLSCCAAQRHDIIRIDAEDVSGPCIERRRALAGEVVSLVDGGNPEQFGRLMGEDLVNHDRIEAEPCQGRDARAPQIMKAPRGKRYGLASRLLSLFGSRIHDRRVKRRLGSRDPGNRGLASGAEYELV